MEDWQSIGIKQTGQSKMVDVAMELAEAYRQEGRMETARRMLAAGYGLEQICELCELSEEHVSRLRSP